MPPPDEVGARHLALEIPEDRLLFAIAEEAGLRDRDLDQIEATLAAETDPARAHALALTLGRSGRASSRAVIERAARACPDGAFDLAIDLLDLRPARTERADRGYRFTAAPEAPLYVEDPLAAHWHGLNRWGPPIRPDPEARPIVPDAGASLASLERAALDGATIVWSFAPGPFERAHPALRLVLAGFARSPSLGDLVRWRDVASVGVLEQGRTRVIACARAGGEPIALGSRPRLGESRLLDLMGRLLRQSRS